MADQTIPDYETIRAAVTGETWAVEKVLMCYKDEIDRQATVKKRQSHSLCSCSPPISGRRNISGISSRSRHYYFA